MEESELIKKRFEDLYSQSEARGIFTFTDFLTLAEQDVLLSLKLNKKPVLFGGAEGCERVVCRFGDEEELGYSEGFPIALLEIKPKDAKFADDLTHRDILGALMNLGVKRQVLGDIVVREDAIYVFCLEKIADHIAQNLKRAKHTDLVISRRDCLPEGEMFKTTQTTVLCASERIDLVIAKLFGLSRSEASELFRQQLVFIGGAQCRNPERICEKGDVISVRGHGKFVYDGVISVSKKGKYNIQLSLKG